MRPGVKIVLATGNGPPQTLYYFRTDVSNSGVNASGFLKFAATLGNGNGLLKSASYLMHSGNFTQVRDFVLEHSQSIVQDDSGIPLASFRPDVVELPSVRRLSRPDRDFPRAATSRGLANCSGRPRRRRLISESAIAIAGTIRNLLLAVRKDQLKLGSPQTTQSAPPATATTSTVPPPVPPANIPTAPPLRGGLAADDKAPAPAEKQE